MHCAVHQDQLAFGICVSCSLGVCVRCTTRLQGRNFCSSCLDQLLEAERGRQLQAPGPLLRAAVLFVVLASGFCATVAISAIGFLLYLAP